jgi:hypothetical protein
MQAGAESEGRATTTADGFEFFRRLSVVLRGRTFAASFRSGWLAFAGFATSEAKLDPLGRDDLPFDLFSHGLDDEDAEATSSDLAVLSGLYFAAQGTETVFAEALPFFFEILIGAVSILFHELDDG